MKNLIVLMLSILFVSSASAECLNQYKTLTKRASKHAAMHYATIVAAPIGALSTYYAHQMKKMGELIEEAKRGNTKKMEKRTKGLFKSLNGMKSPQEIHELVLEGNKRGVFCRKFTGDVEVDVERLTTYRKFKEMLRFLIDTELSKSGKKVIWNQDAFRR